MGEWVEPAALESWLEKALEHDAEERDSWLEQAIDDPPLRQRVREIVARAEVVGDFLERPAAEVIELPTPPAEDAALPSTIGPYRILGVLGEGGMGVVYLAQQDEPVRRQLALKVLRAVLMTPQAALRFESEGQILARLGHPYIAALYEAGKTDAGDRYFAMERVDGAPLIEACDAERLSIGARIALFLDVCDGVQHAHQKGILHRDLKPSNILVSRLGERLVPKIIDFGIARILDTEVTLSGPIGTPDYMSPESFATGEPTDPDIRSDVYSLGVLFYELLTGERPYGSKGSTPAELALAIARHDVEPPSRAGNAPAAIAERNTALRGLDRRSLGRRLAGDLDAIVVRATARKPEDRYPTVAEMAADLRRHLRHLPVEAVPAGWRYRLSRLARRHRAGFAAAVVSLLALLAGAIGTTLGLVRAAREAQSARRALAEAQEMSRFVTGLFEVSDPDRSRGEDLRVRELLDRAVVDVRSRFADQPASRARFQRTLGDIFVHLGLWDEAQPLLEESLALFETDAVASEVAAGRRSLGILAWRAGRHQEAEELLGSALALSEGDDERVATLLNDLAVLLLDLHRLDEAEPLFRRSLAMREARYGRRHPDVAAVLGGLGFLLRVRERFDESEALQREALAIRRTALGPDHPQVAANLNNLALLELATGRLEEAGHSLRQAAAIWEKVFGHDHPQVTVALQALARIARREQRLDEAEALLLQCVEILEASYGSEHKRLGPVLNSLGVLYWNQGKHREAEPILRRTLALYTATLGEKNSRVGYPLSNLGLVLWRLGDLENAEALLRRALELWRQPDENSGGIEHQRKLHALWGLAGLMSEAGDFAEAESLYRRALAIAERAPEGASVPPVREDFAALLRASGRDEDARILESGS